jgi:hypothetical protein
MDAMRRPRSLVVVSVVSISTVSIAKPAIVIAGRFQNLEKFWFRIFRVCPIVPYPARLVNILHRELPVFAPLGAVVRGAGHAEATVSCYNMRR